MFVCTTLFVVTITIVIIVFSWYIFVNKIAHLSKTPTNTFARKSALLKVIEVAVTAAHDLR